MATTIDVRADTASAVASLNALNAALGSNAERVKQVNSVVGVFNELGVQIGATIKGLTQDGKEFTATLGLAGKAAADLAKLGIATDLALKGLKFKEVAKDVENLDQKTSLWNATLTRIGRNLVQFASYRAFNTIANDLTSGVQAAKDFQIQLSLIRTISQDNQQSFAKFGQDVRKISDDAGIDIKNVGKAFYDTISNQIAKGANTAGFVKTAGELSRVTGSELPDSVNLLSSAINAYGLSVNDAERLSVVFFKTIDEGRVVASELANTFGRVGVLGSNLGIGIEDLNAVLAITTQKGFKTADAMTLLTNLLIKLEKPTDATQAFFRSLGVNSGEAAIKLLGFNGVLRKMVDAVKSGQVDVSAFFDEIRGRKQFGVFEQSIDQIEQFANKLKDVKSVTEDYNKAVGIRGESAADLLIKETNKLSNIFKVDLGQSIVETTAKLLTFVGGVENVRKNIETLGPIITHIGIGLSAYAVIAGVVAVRNYAGAASFAALSTAAKLFLPVLAAYGGFELGKRLNRLLGVEGKTSNFDDFDPKRFNDTGTAIKKIKDEIEKAAQASKTFVNPFAAIDAQKDKIAAAYKDIAGLVAGANIANNKFLQEARDKSKTASEAIKVGFAGYTDTIKSRINEVKKAITEANNEVEKSRKSMLRFKESLDDLVFNTQLKYANDQIGEQKINLTEQRIKGLIGKATDLFKIGTPESIDEARKLFDEIAKLEADNFDRRQDLRKHFLEESLKSDPSLNGQGANVLNVSTEELQLKLNKLLSLRNSLEDQYVEKKLKGVKVDEKRAADESARLRRLEAALKAFEDLDVFNKDGGIKSEFKDSQGKFDSSKFNLATQQIQNQIRASASEKGDNSPEDFERRFQLEVLLSQKRVALIKEAQAVDREQSLKTYEQRLLSEQEGYQKRLDNIKREQQERQKAGEGVFSQIGNKSFELVEFARRAAESGALDTGKQAEVAKSLEAFQQAVTRLKNNQIDKDGLKIFDPNRAQDAADAYERVLNIILKARDASKNKASLSFKDAEGNDITPGGAKEVFGNQVKELQRLYTQQLSSLTEQKAEGGVFDLLVNKPIQDLKAAFPEIANSAKTSSEAINSSFKDLANGGINDLKKQLEAINKLLKENAALQGQKISAVIGEGGEAYAATGGIVGMFPGQPRGMDQYPIWAAKGERIVDSYTSALYKPQLDAIMSRRMPRYMAGGGVVGGDTNIGDIIVTVNGGRTNNDTGRALATKLERELRRNNISLQRK